MAFLHFFSLQKSAIFTPQDFREFWILYSEWHIWGGLYRQFVAEFFEVFFLSISTQDGFITIPNDNLAGFTPVLCVVSLIFVPFDPFVVGRKVPNCALSM